MYEVFFGHSFVLLFDLFPSNLSIFDVFLKREWRDSFWKLVGEMGNDVVLGLDAHHVRMIDVPDVEEKAMKMVKDYNLKLIPTPLPEMK